MKIYTVIPITKTVGKETLSYFGKEGIAPGALVTIPLRKKNVPALVVGSEDVDKLKSSLRSSSFSLKKIGGLKAKSFLDGAFLKAAEETSRWYATSTGSVLSLILPKLLLEEMGLFAEQDSPTPQPNNHEKLLLQADDDERFAHYKSFIRGEFAKKQSVFFCVPTLEDAHKAKKNLEKGIEHFTLVLESKMGKKEFRKAIEKIQTEKHPLLIIGTIPFLSVCRNDIGTIVVERENSRAYRTQSRPFIDLKLFAENLAKHRDLKYLAGDVMLSVETIWRKKERDEFVGFTPLKFRSLSSAQSKLVDMKNEPKESDSSFKILSDDLLALIEKAKENNDKLFIYGARKGLAPITVCGDCGQVVVCKICKAPVTLYGKEGGRRENTFICNRCGETETSERRCSNCNSWKLKMLGIGVELIEQSVKEKVPEAKVFVVDKDRTSTPKKASEVIRKFKETPGSILIGTEMALFYLNEPIEHVAVASIDSLLAVPDFRMNEKTLYLLLKMRLLAQKNFLVQTRNADEVLFDYALKGNLIDFYRKEMSMRKQFKYPPFKIFIKLSIEGTPAATHKLMDNIEEDFKDFDIDVFESAYASRRGRTIMHAIIRVRREKWPDEELLQKLDSLPRYVSIKVDPEGIL